MDRLGAPWSNDPSGGGESPPSNTPCVPARLSTHFLTSGGDALGDAFEDLAEDLERAITWLRSFGLRADISRFGKNRKTLREFNQIRKSGSVDLVRDTRVLQALVASLPDVYELTTIHRNLLSHADAYFIERAKKLLKGPEREADEKLTSIIGRNTGFELMLACKIAAGGVVPNFSGPGDLSVAHDLTRTNIECKRFQSRRNVDRVIADACSQLKRRATEAPDLDSIGVIALAIGKVIHRGEEVLVAGSRESALEKLNMVTQEFVDEHHGVWQRNVGSAVDAVLIYLSAIAEIPATRSFLWTQTLGHFMVKEGREEYL